MTTPIKKERILLIGPGEYLRHELDRLYKNEISDLKCDCINIDVVDSGYCGDSYHCSEYYICTIIDNLCNCDSKYSRLDKNIVKYAYDVCDVTIELHDMRIEYFLNMHKTSCEYTYIVANRVFEHIPQYMHAELFYRLHLHLSSKGLLIFTVPTLKMIWDYYNDSDKTLKGSLMCNIEIYNGINPTYQDHKFMFTDEYVDWLATAENKFEVMGEGEPWKSYDNMPPFYMQYILAPNKEDTEDIE